MRMLCTHWNPIYKPESIIKPVHTLLVSIFTGHRLTIVYIDVIFYIDKYL